MTLSVFENTAPHQRWHRRLLLAAQIAAFGFASVSDAHQFVLPENAQKESQPRVVRFPIDPDSLVIVDASIQGKLGKFVLDTGSSICVLDEDDRNLLGPILRTVSVAKSSEGSLQLPIFASKQLLLKDLFLEPGRFNSVLDLDLIEQSCGEDLLGIIGSENIEGLRLGLTYSQNEGFLDRSTTNPRQPRQEALKILKYDEMGSEALECMISREMPKLPFLVDTGSSGSVVLTKALFDLLVKEEQIVDIFSDKTIDAGGVTENLSGTLASFRIANYELKSLPVTVGVSNAIGIGVLSRFDIVFDFKRNDAILNPSKYFDRVAFSGRTGLRVIGEGGKYTVASVDLNSPASHAGFQAGDRLISINSAQTKAMRMADIRRALARPDGEPVVIGLSRNKMPLEKQLVFENPW